MSELDLLPHEWSWRPLGQYAEVTGGYGFPKKYQGRTDLPYPFIKVLDMNTAGDEIYVTSAAHTIDDTVAHVLRVHIFPRNTIIFPKIGGAIATNKKRLLGCPATFDNNVMGVVAGPSLSYKWCYYFFRNVDLMELARIGPVPSIRQSAVKEMLIPIPYSDNPAQSRTEQHRIVARLEALLGEVREMRALQAEIEADVGRLMHAVLGEMFGAVGVEIDTLGNRCHILGGGTLPKAETGVSAEDAVLLLKVSELNRVENTPIIMTAKERISLQTANRRRYRLIAPGSIIIPKRGGAIATNKKRMLSKPAILDPNLMAITPMDAALRSRYLLYWFELLDLIGITSGSTVPQLNRQDLVPLKIQVPPIDVQDEIITYLDAIRAEMKEMVDLQTPDSISLQELEQSILAQAFRGEL